jgi:hypothetical protein
VTSTVAQWAVEVRVAKRRRDVEDRFGRERRRIHLVDRPNALQQGESHGEEPGIRRSDRERVDPFLLDACREREHGQRLLFQPLEGLGTQPFERAAEPVGVADLVGGPVVPDHQALRISPTHVGLYIVGADAVADATNPGLEHLAASGHLVADFVETARIGVSDREIGDLLDRRRDDDGRRGLEYGSGIGGGSLSSRHLSWLAAWSDAPMFGLLGVSHAVSAGRKGPSRLRWPTPNTTYGRRRAQRMETQASKLAVTATLAVDDSAYERARGRDVGFGCPPRVRARSEPDPSPGACGTVRRMLPIYEVASKLGVPTEHVVPYGRDKAKVDVAVRQTPRALSQP